MTKSYQKYAIIAVTASILLFIGYSHSILTRDKRKVEKFRQLKKRLGNSYNEDEWPKKLNLGNNTKVSLSYTFDEKLSSHIKRLLKRYRSDYSAVVVIDNNTGSILSAIGHERSTNEFVNYLPFTSTHPSASLFKIVTAADLIQNSGLDDHSIFTFSGKGKTLYKYQLESKKRRWSRTQSLRKAFAFSNNAVFGKAAINNSNGSRLFQMATNLGFNNQLLRELDHGVSKFLMPHNQYHLAELASGFNDETQISPLHAAVLSSVVANDGIMKSPHMISKVEDSEGEDLWMPKLKVKKVINKSTTDELKELMESTIKIGTAKASFRKMIGRIKKHLDIGGKTGTITGGIPYGKRDWFSAYAMPKNDELDNGISVGIMNINVDKWHVKSSYLAKEVIEYYYKKINPIKKKISITKKDTKKVNGEV